MLKKRIKLDVLIIITDHDKWNNIYYSNASYEEKEVIYIYTATKYIIISGLIDKKGYGEEYILIMLCSHKRGIWVRGFHHYLRLTKL